MSVILLTTDLMLPSQLAGAAAQWGTSLTTASTVEALKESAAKDPPRLVLIDLTLRGLDVHAAVRTVRELPVPPAVVAYGPHVQEALLQSARDAGCSEVLARGQVHRGFSELLARYLGRESGGPK